MPQSDGCLFVVVCVHTHTHTHTHICTWLPCRVSKLLQQMADNRQQHHRRLVCDNNTTPLPVVPATVSDVQYDGHPRWHHPHITIILARGVHRLPPRWYDGGPDGGSCSCLRGASTSAHLEMNRMGSVVDTGVSERPTTHHGLCRIPPTFNASTTASSAHLPATATLPSSSWS